ncbi:hypothetical protein GCM10027596_06400 [Nocardioides korecus]
MTTTFDETDLGPVTMEAPTSPVRHVRATYGHLWQWTGDGEDLFSLSVAVRGTRIGTAQGVRDHLHHELLQMRVSPLPEPSSRPSTEDPRAATGASGVDVWVEGAVGAAAAEMTGEVAGNHVRERVVVTTDGRLMHVIRIFVPDSPAGDEVLARISSSLELRPWEIPA